MDDRENVIRGLECCLSGPMQCDSCPFEQPGEFTGGCAQALKKDAIALLREQEPVEPKRHVTVIRSRGSDGFREDWEMKTFTCALCGHVVKRDENNFCGYCGRAVKWDNA